MVGKSVLDFSSIDHSSGIKGGLVKELLTYSSETVLT